MVGGRHAATAAASTSARSAAGPRRVRPPAVGRHPARSLAAASRSATRSAQRSSARTSPTSSARWSAWASAAAETCQAIGVRASPRPAAAAIAVGTPRRRTTRPSPGGRGDEARRQQVLDERGLAERPQHDRRQPAEHHEGREPRGCIVPSSGSTACASAVSQAPTPGSRVVR